MKTLARIAATTVTMTAGLGLAGLGTATVAQAHTDPRPAYHWCPGEDWHPDWGNNWDGGNCHDDHHRDNDGPDHRRDFGWVPWGFDRRYIPRYHWCPGDFWRPEWGFNFDWGNCHDDHHRDVDGDNRNNDYWG